MIKDQTRGSNLNCSFCGKSQKEVRKLIAGPSVFICDDCVRICEEIIAEDSYADLDILKEEIPRPKEIKKFLDEYRHRSGAGQEEAGRGRLQPLPAHRALPQGQARRRRRGAPEKQHPAHRTHRLGQDALAQTLAKS